MSGRSDGASVLDVYAGLLEVLEVIPLERRVEPPAQAPTPEKPTGRWRLLTSRTRVVDGHFVTDYEPGARPRLDVFRPRVVRECPLVQTEARVPLTDDEEGAWFEDPASVPASHYRGDDGSLRCPWVSCVHHLWSEVTPAGARSGSFRVNATEYESPADMPDPCGLLHPNEDGDTTEEVGDVLMLSPERIRQIERSAIVRLKSYAWRDPDGVVHLRRVR